METIEVRNLCLSGANKTFKRNSVVRTTFKAKSRIIRPDAGSVKQSFCTFEFVIRDESSQISRGSSRRLEMFKRPEYFAWKFFTAQADRRKIHDVEKQKQRIEAIMSINRNDAHI